MPEAKEKEGREPDATVLSARDLSCSDQLKPWSIRVAERRSEVALGRVRGVVDEVAVVAVLSMSIGIGCA